MCTVECKYLLRSDMHGEFLGVNRLIDIKTESVRTKSVKYKKFTEHICIIVYKVTNDLKLRCLLIFCLNSVSFWFQNYQVYKTESMFTEL